MSRKLRITIVLLLFLLLIVSIPAAFLAYQSHTQRELFFRRNGLPLANLTGSMLLMGYPSSGLVPAKTDTNGRLDLDNLPMGVTTIRLELKDNNGIVYCELLQLPHRGSRIIDLRGNTTIITTTYTAFCGLIKQTEKETCVQTPTPNNAKPGTPSPANPNRPTPPPSTSNK